MVPATRRALLRGAAAAAVGLAGCSGTSSSGANRSNHPSDAEHLRTDPEAVALRHSGDEPVAWIGAADPPTPTGDRAGALAAGERGLVAEPDRAGDLHFADVPGADDARSFVASTAFEEETLLLETRKVAECYRLDLCAVTWSADSYHSYFGRKLRPVDVACRADARDRVAYLVRIPAVLDPGEIRSRGSGSTSRTCEAYDRRFERRRGR